jgi:ribonuclease HI
MIKGYFDGACEPINPYGNMGIGAILLKDNETIFSHSEFVPASKSNSNNVAEYMALEKILTYIRDTTIIEQKIFIYGDSKLVIMQMKGSWRIKGGLYVPAARRCKELQKEIEQEIQKKLLFNWIPRELNQMADDLSKAKMIEHKVDFKIQPNEV